MAVIRRRATALVGIAAASALVLSDVQHPRRRPAVQAETQVQNHLRVYQPAVKHMRSTQVFLAPRWRSTPPS